MDAEFCYFLLLRKKSVGKSISENENIKIGETMSPQTSEVNSLNVK